MNKFSNFSDEIFIQDNINRPLLYGNIKEKFIFKFIFFYDNKTYYFSLYNKFDLGKKVKYFFENNFNSLQRRTKKNFIFKLRKELILKFPNDGKILLNILKYINY